MVKVSATEISAQFDGLISGAHAPEQVERWASERMRAGDAGELTFDPPGDEARLWDAILYLLGVGLRIGPGEYLHTPADFDEYRQATGL